MKIRPRAAFAAGICAAALFAQQVKIEPRAKAPAKTTAKQDESRPANINQRHGGQNQKQQRLKTDQDVRIIQR